jgi:hypothetical protein
MDIINFDNGYFSGEKIDFQQEHSKILCEIFGSPLMIFIAVCCSIVALADIAGAVEMIINKSHIIFAVLRVAVSVILCVAVWRIIRHARKFDILDSDFNNLQTAMYIRLVVLIIIIVIALIFIAGGFLVLTAIPAYNGVEKDYGLIAKWGFLCTAAVYLYGIAAVSMIIILAKSLSFGRFGIKLPVRKRKELYILAIALFVVAVGYIALAVIAGGQKGIERRILELGIFSCILNSSSHYADDMFLKITDYIDSGCEIISFFLAGVLAIIYAKKYNSLVKNFQLNK